MRVLFHPKQLLLFSGGDDTEVRVWDLVEKRCVATLQVRSARRSCGEAVCACRCAAAPQEAVGFKGWTDALSPVVDIGAREGAGWRAGGA